MDIQQELLQDTGGRVELEGPDDVGPVVPVVTFVADVSFSVVD